MGFHHVALATRDIDATHRFYTEVMGFDLVKVVIAGTENPGGWAKHIFYDTGDGGLIAFWDIHDDAVLAGPWTGDLNKSIGLPVFVNHVAFDAVTLDGLEARKQRWRQNGITVTEIDHGFCRSIYATDPNNILVEFCCTTRPFTEEELADAPRLLDDAAPELEAPPEMTFWSPVEASSTVPS
jgi:catechol 2,3-dioxygenase-like lactoylglutathione lyase family enzyme